MNIIIFGPPLAGKGTQSKKIINDFGLTHLSTGDILRHEKDEKTDLGIQASEYSKKGLLVPDDLVVKVVEKFYLKNSETKGLLFDGYPRNIAQAKHLVEFLKEQNDTIDLIIHLDVKNEELFKRAEKRALEQNRKDDKDPEIVKTRIKEFGAFTLPAVDFIKSQNIKTVSIDGNESIDSIYEIIKNNINSCIK